jgi:DNA-binding LacI/PurR family transcriptional regulator
VSLQQLHADWHIEYQASHRADGLILLGYGDYRTYREKLQALAAANTRFIIFGPKVKSYPNNSIGCDNVSGGEQATSHLLNLGRRRIAFLGNTTRRCPEFADRYAGYVEAHRKAGIEPAAELKLDADNLEQLGIEAVHELLRSGAAFDAIFAVTDVIAIGAIRALQENGLSVPGDVSVVGFDDMPLAAHVAPALTTVRQDIRLASKSLVAAIVEQIEGQPTALNYLDPKLIIRDSCGAPH